MGAKTDFKNLPEIWLSSKKRICDNRHVFEVTNYYGNQFGLFIDVIYLHCKSEMKGDIFIPYANKLHWTDALL